MASGLKSRGIEGESGYIANVNSSGQLAVDAIVSVGAVSVGISGQPLIAQGMEYVTSGFHFLPLTQSGMRLSGVPYRLIVAFSGDSVAISGETVALRHGSGFNAVYLTNQSGNLSVRVADGTFDDQLNNNVLVVASQLQGWDEARQRFQRIRTTESGSAASFGGTTFRLLTCVSGDPVTVSGNTVVAKTSGETHISLISGQTIIALISGQTIVSELDLSGVTLNVDNIDVNISGQVVRAEVSGDKIRLQAFDFSGLTYRDLGVDVSGGSALKVNASISANISGQTVRTFAASGQNSIYLTNQSGNLAALVRGPTTDDLVTSSGVGLFGTNTIMGYDETADRLNRVRTTISGDTLSAGGTNFRLLVCTSGDAVKISGNVVNISGFPVSVSGGVAKISGETVRFWPGSGHNGVYLTNRSGSLEVIVDASGRLVATVSGAAINVTSGQVQITSGVVTISGNAVNVTSGQVQITSGVVTISGNLVNAALVVSGNVPVARIVTISGTAAIVTEGVKSHFMAFEATPITALSGGTQLLSGQSRTVTIRNIGRSGTSMFVGSSGTNRAPWMATAKSGRGWRMDDGDAITIPINNPELIRVVTLSDTSGEPVTYAVNDY